MNEPLSLAAKAPFMIVSALLSFMLWIGLQITQPPGSITTDIKVGMVNYEPYETRYVIPTTLDPVPLRIEGPADQLKDDQGTLDRILRENRVYVYVDFNDLRPGTNSYTLHLASRQDSPFTFTLIDRTIKVDVEQRAMRPFPIRIDVTGEISDPNLVYNGATSSPSSVMVEGPAPAVARVKRVRAFLNLSEVTSAGYQEVALEPVDENDSQVLEVDVNPTVSKIVVSVAPAAQSQTVMVEPNMTGHPAKGFELYDYTVEPRQIAVQGSPAILSKLRTVTTEPVNLDGLRTSTTFEKPLLLPPGVTSYSFKSIRVQVTVKASDVTSTSGAANQSVAGP